MHQASRTWSRTHSKALSAHTCEHVCMHAPSRARTWWFTHTHTHTHTDTNAFLASVSTSTKQHTCTCKYVYAACKKPTSHTSPKSAWIHIHTHTQYTRSQKLKVKHAHEIHFLIHTYIHTYMFKHQISVSHTDPRDPPPPAALQRGLKPAVSEVYHNTQSTQHVVCVSKCMCMWNMQFHEQYTYTYKKSLVKTWPSVCDDMYAWV